MSYYDETELAKLARKRLGRGGDTEEVQASTSSFLDVLKANRSPNMSKWASLVESPDGEQTADARKDLDNAEEIAAALGNDDESLGQKAAGILTGGLDFIDRTASAGAAFFKEAAGFDAKTGDRESRLPASILNIPGVGVAAGLIADALDDSDGDRFGAFTGAWDGLVGGENIDWKDTEPLRKDDDDNWAERWGKSALGFGLDVGTDPLTYVTFGAAGVAKKAGSEIVESSVENAVSKSGIADDALEGAAGRWRNTEVSDELKTKFGLTDEAVEMNRELASELGDDAVEQTATAADEALVKQLAGAKTAPKAADKAKLADGDKAEMLTHLKGLHAAEDAGKQGLLSVREKAVDVFKAEAAAAYATRGHRGLLQYLESDAVPDELVEVIWDALPKNLKGGIQLKSLKRTKTGARDTIRLTDGMLADKVGLGRLADAKHDAGNWLRTSKAGRLVADRMTGREGAAWGAFLHSATRGADEAGGLDYGQYRLLSEAGRSERVMRAQLGSLAVTAIHGARQTIDQLPKQERQAAHDAARDFYKTGVSELPEGASAAQVAGFEAVQKLRGIQAELLDRARAEGMDIGELNDYMFRMQTEDYKALRQAQSHLASGAVRGSGAAPAKHRVAFFDLNSDGTPAYWDNDKINELMKDKLGGKAALEEDPFVLASSYAATMTRAVTEKHWYNRLRDSGLTVADAGNSKKMLNKLELDSTYRGLVDKLDEEAARISGRLEQLGGIEGSNVRPAERLRGTAAQRRTQADELDKAANEIELRVHSNRNNYGISAPSAEAAAEAREKAIYIRQSANDDEDQLHYLRQSMQRRGSSSQEIEEAVAQARLKIQQRRDEADALERSVDPFATDLAEAAEYRRQAAQSRTFADQLDEQAEESLIPKTGLLDDIDDERNHLESTWNQVDAERRALHAALKDNATVADLINTFSDDPAVAVREAGELIGLLEETARGGVARKNTVLGFAEQRLARDGDTASEGLRTHVEMTKRERGEFEDMVASLRKQTDVTRTEREASAAAQLLASDFGWQKALEVRENGVKNFRSATEDTSAVYALPAVRTMIDRRNALANNPTAFTKLVENVYSPLYVAQKAWMTVGRGPGYHVRNGIGAAINNWLIGVEAVDYVAVAKLEAARTKIVTDLMGLTGAKETAEQAAQKAAQRKAWKAASPELRQEMVYQQWHTAVADMELAPGVKAGDLLDAAKNHGVLDSPRLLEDVSSAGNGMRNMFATNAADLNVAQKAWNKTTDNKLIDVSAQLAQNEERYFRMAALLNGAKRYGISDGGQAAAVQVKISQFDYDDLSDFERTWMRNIVPFYTFTRHNLPLQVRAMVNEPGKIANQFKLYDASMDAVGAEEDEETPSWAADAFGRTLGADSMLGKMLGIGENDELVLRMESPTVALNQWGTTGGVGDWATLARTSMLSQANPIVKGLVNLGGDTDIDTGATVSESRNAAPNWMRQLEKVLPGEVLLNRSAKAGDEPVSAAPGITNLVSDWVPPLGMYERLMPWERPEKYDTRSGTSWASTLTGAPVSTLDDTQRAGELGAQERRVRDWYDQKAGELGIDPREVSKLIQKYGVEQVEAYIASGQMGRSGQ